MEKNKIVMNNKQAIDTILKQCSNSMLSFYYIILDSCVFKFTLPQLFFNIRNSIVTKIKDISIGGINYDFK